MQQTNVSFIPCLLASYPNLHHPLYSEKLRYFVFSKLSTKGRSQNRRDYISVNSVTSENSNTGKTTLIQVLMSQYWFISALMKNNNLNHNRLFYNSPYTVEKAVFPRITSVLQVSHHVM